MRQQSLTKILRRNFHEKKLESKKPTKGAEMVIKKREERREKNLMKIKVKRVKKKQYIYVCKFDNFLKFPSLNENGEVKKPVEKTLCHFILINYNHIDNTCNHPAIQHIDLMKILSIKFENNNEININEFPSQNF